MIKRSMQNISRYTYLTFLVIMTGLKAFIGFDSMDTIYLVLGGIAVFFAFLSAVTTRYTGREMLVLGVIGILIGIVFYRTHSLTPLLLLAAIPGAKNVDKEKTMTLLGYVWLVGFVLTVSLAALGLIPMHERFDWNHETMRYGMGYKTDNLFHLVLFYIVTLWGYLKKNKKWWMYLLLAGINNIVYFLTDCRIGLLITYMSLLAWALYPYLQKKTLRMKIVNLLVGIAAIFPVLLSMMPAVFRNSTNPIWDRLDHLFTHRVIQIRECYSQYPLSLFGTPAAQSTFFMDNAYAYMLLKYGVVFFAFFCGLYVWLFCKKDETYLKEKLIALLMLICGIVEQSLQNCFMNFSLLIIIFLLWDEAKNYQEKGL